MSSFDSLFVETDDALPLDRDESLCTIHIQSDKDINEFKEIMTKVCILLCIHDNCSLF